MKNLLTLIALVLFIPSFLLADLPLDKKTAPGKITKQAVAQAARKQAAAPGETRTFEILKKISSQQKLMERQRREIGKAQTSWNPPPPLPRPRQAEFLGKRIPFLEAPAYLPSSGPETSSRIASTSNALINGKPADTVYVGDKEVLTFSFAPGYVSAAFLVYYDADGDGLVGKSDPLLSSSILLMDNDENDGDPAPGKYTLRSGGSFSLSGLVGSYILSVNDFQSVSNALLLVRQKPAPSLVRIATNPPVPLIVIQVGGGGLSEALFADSTGRAQVSVNRLDHPQLGISLFDYVGNAGSYRPPASQNVLISRDTTDVVFNFVTAPSFIRGVYRDDVGNPIPGARVSASGPGYGVKANTDSAGSFTLGVDTGSWYAWIRPGSADYMTSSGGVIVDVTPNSTTTVNFTALKTNSAISGNVHYLSGGVGGVLVEGRRDTLSNGILTGADGSYSLPVWKPQTGWVNYGVYPSLGNYTYFVAETLAANVQPGTQNVNFTLLKLAGGMAGKVLDARTGRPVRGASVTLAGTVYRSCTTDDSGSYAAVLKDGYYLVSVYAQGYFSYSSPNQIAVFGSVVTFDVLLSPSGAISGTIRDSEGKTIPSVSIAGHDTTYLLYGSGFSDASGRYVMRNLRTGSYVVSAEGNGYLQQYYPNTTDPLQATLVSVEEGSETPNIDFVLSKGGAIAGKVTDLVGKQLSGAAVSVYDTSYTLRSYVNSDLSGSFVASGLATGEYLVYVSAYPYISVWYDNALTYATATRVRVTGDDTTHNIDFSLANGASLSGYVRDDRKKPVPSVWVYTVDTLGLGYQGQATDESGLYQISGLPTGVYKTSSQPGGVFVPQWYDHKASFDVADTIKLAPEQTRGGIDFDLHHVPGIYGSVLDESSGTAVPNATISIMSDDGAYYTGGVDYNGSYGIMLPSGNYLIRVSCDEGNYACRYYYRSDGLVVAAKDAETVTVDENGVSPVVDFRLPADEKESAVTISNLGVTMTNRGVLGNSGDSTRPSCRWPNPLGKNYLFESDLWVGGNFGGVNRVFGDFYGGAPGRWHPSTNFSPPEDKDFERVRTFFSNTDYTDWWFGISVLVRQEIDSWPGTDFVLCRQTLIHDAHPTDTPPAVSGLYAGLFADFDVSGGAQTDLVGIDTASGLIYMYDNSKTDSTYIGACLLGSRQARLSWWNARSDTAHYSESARRQLLTAGTAVSLPTQADDYRVLVSTGPYTLNPGDSLEVSMALVAGKGKQALIAAAQAAEAKYIALTTGVDDPPSARVPTEFALSQNYPNPFNPATNITFDLPRRSHVSLRVFNVLGQQVATLIDEVRFPGHYAVPWSGSSLASGVYFYSLKAESFVQTKKMLLLK